MYVLCDTCSVLMLIRIAPDMFTDERYECVTVPEVRQEFFQTQRFKTKYPWRAQFKKQIKALTASELEDGNFKLYFSAIKNLHEAGVINRRTKRFFSLSYVDQRIAAYTAANNYILTSTDADLTDFVTQQFEGQTITPLGIVNDWMKKGLIEWNNKLQGIIEDWDRCNEHPQPKSEVKRFIKLTRHEYPGPIKR